MTATAVRRANVADAARLAELGARLFEQTFGAANDPEDMRMYLASAFSEQLQRGELADERYVAWLAQADGLDAGYAMLRRRSRKDSVAFERPAEVQRIYVDRPWQGQGVADALMSACVDEARADGADGIWLAVWEKNPRAIAFYQRVGFTVVGRTTFTLGRDVQNDLLMARPLG